ncbi:MULTISPECIES: hypothetical protein [unclassified Lentimicrobium]|uniref:type IV toxin-antitoxin system AbiEi family antitoxin domain-containing protein n=1 Tax=unclassified Lentimicrobium TaxID=2677434 RepID=UPI0015580837|nr:MULTISPECIES: hypothetical protein [unclassified Lentimicrobium]NPD43950.1 hypothetical protein [Lentimicrobium sp. S6]NPD84165.1 hypothetical protein [Lentimicrobium sp. L6]
MDYIRKYSIMIGEIERELSKIKTHIIDHSSISSILMNLGYFKVNDKINHLKQKGVLKPIKKGLYYHSSIITKNIISKELLANTILGPSYISLEYALSYHGLIPESVFQLTSVCTKRSKQYDTELGVFSYKHIKKELFSIGLKIEHAKNGFFMIATKEKALCDMIYLKNTSFFSKKELIAFLEDDLRIDIVDLNNLNIEIINDYYQKSKSKRIAIFLKLLKNN